MQTDATVKGTRNQQKKHHNGSVILRCMLTYIYSPRPMNNVSLYISDVPLEMSFENISFMEISLLHKTQVFITLLHFINSLFNLHPILYSKSAPLAFFIYSLLPQLNPPLLDSYILLFICNCEKSQMAHSYLEKWSTHVRFSVPPHAFHTTS